MTPEPTTTTTPPDAIDLAVAAAELQALGELIRSHQLDRGHTDSAFLRLYPRLGKDRTYSRIHTGNGIDELNIAEWIHRYRGVWEQIESGSATLEPEPVYDDLAAAQEVRRAWLALMNQTGLQRLVLIVGDTGTGKSSALRALEQRLVGGCHLIEAHEGWSRLRPALECFAAGLGIDGGDAAKAPKSASQWLEHIVAHLNKRGRLVIAIDEVHHVGGEFLNALKTLINRTSCVFLIAGMKTLVEKLVAAKRQEARQLFQNRLLRQITLGVPSAADASAYLTRRAHTEVSADVLTRVLRLAASHGNFAFVRRVGAHLAALPAAAPRDSDAILQATADALADLGVANR
jgi:type II secretory pathway predicted ATPase ExeA